MNDFKSKAQSLLDDFLLGLDKLVDLELDKIADLEHEKNGYIAMQSETQNHKKHMEQSDAKRQEEFLNKRGELELAIRDANGESNKWIQKNRELELVLKDQSLYLQSIKDDKKISEDKVKVVDALKGQYELKLASLKLDQDKLISREHGLNDRESKLKVKDTALLSKESQLKDKEADLEIRYLELEKKERLVGVNLLKLEKANGESKA